MKNYAELLFTDEVRALQDRGGVGERKCIGFVFIREEEIQCQAEEK